MPWNKGRAAVVGRELHLFQLFDNGAWASLDIANNRIIQVHGDAWRWLGWLAQDPATGQLTRYPAEVFGPLPTFNGG